MNAAERRNDQGQHVGDVRHAVTADSQVYVDSVGPIRLQEAALLVGIETEDGLDAICAQFATRSAVVISLSSDTYVIHLAHAGETYRPQTGSSVSIPSKSGQESVNA